MRKWRRDIFKKISHVLLLPISKWYMSTERKATVDGIALTVQVGVFHPTFFFSTKFLLAWLKTQSLQNRSVLELGAGTGLLSIYAAKQGAMVHASDISETACANVEVNVHKNNVKIDIVRSDLFTDIPWQHFDLILINPPYYAKTPNTESEYAWFCGEDFEYFQKLFFQMRRFMKATSKAIMVLSEDCNIAVIQSLAQQHDFCWQMVQQKKMLFEENYLFEITTANVQYA
jgi:release factor glutamine methyltransferase